MLSSYPWFSLPLYGESSSTPALFKLKFGLISSNFYFHVLFLHVADYIDIWFK